MNSVQHTFNTVWSECAKSLPTIFVGLLILVGGWILAKLIEKLVLKLTGFLSKSKLANWLSLESLGEKIGTTINLPFILSKAAYWIVFLFFIVAASETFGWTNVSKEISRFVAYLPRIFSAVLIFALGYTIAVFLKNTIQSLAQTTGLALGGLLSQIVFYFLLVIITITALAQAGVNTTFISANAVIIVGAFAITFALAAGLGAKQVVADLFINFFNRKMLSVGDKVKFDEIIGVVEEVTKTSIVLRQKESKVVIPARQFYEKSYEIIDDKED